MFLKLQGWGRLFIPPHLQPSRTRQQRSDIPNEEQKKLVYILGLSPKVSFFLCSSPLKQAEAQLVTNQFKNKKKGDSVTAVEWLCLYTGLKLQWKHTASVRKCLRYQEATIQTTSAEPTQCLEEAEIRVWFQQSEKLQLFLKAGSCI